MKIGVIGGGQLCKMIGEEIKNKSLPHKIIALDPTANCPAKPFVEEVIVGSFKDEEKIYELSKKVDIITFEIELANSKVLEKIKESGVDVEPIPSSLFTIQNKFRQKSFLKDKGIPVPVFEKISSKEGIEKFSEKFGYPLILKATEDSYDGRGNFVINSRDDIEEGLQIFEGRELMIEEFLDFEKEISVIATRFEDGSISTFDVSENIHKDNILHMTICPARISNEVKSRVDEVAIKLRESFGGKGTFGIEMFLTKDKAILINEIAPRVHNSGHHTIEGFESSQFEQHIRAVTNMKPGSNKLVSNSIMINILGPKNFEGKYDIESNLPDNATLHMYGKEISKPKRKMGHVTITGVLPEEAEEIAKNIILKPKNE